MKIGRNAPCHCGSGYKYKKCHLVKDELRRRTPLIEPSPEMQARIRQLFVENKAQEKQRKAQQGLGRPIISTVNEDGWRFVAVANRIFYSRNWRTVHDFLFEYIARVLDVAWMKAEASKPLAERHPIAQWNDALVRMQRAAGGEVGKVKAGTPNGGASAYLRLAYDLYCVAHNAKLQHSLVGRLKDPNNFRGAHYETYVAATFMRAGFTVEFEDEQDRRSTHCEFVATHKSGRAYSVEAKRRHRDVERPLSKLRIGTHLFAALEKRAAHPRVVFIDMNMATPMDEDQVKALIFGGAAQVSKFERTQRKANPFDPAYVFLTNQPIPADLDAPPPPAAAVASSYRIPDFAFHAPFKSLLDMHRARIRHRDMHDLFESMGRYTSVPATFDGENPELAFREDQPAPLVVGKTYEVPLGNGTVGPGLLVEATMMEAEKKGVGHLPRCRRAANYLHESGHGCGVRGLPTPS